MIDVEKFKEARQRLKLSQAALAKAAGVSQQLIGEIEKSRTKTTKSIYKIAKALNLKAHELDADIPGPDLEWEDTLNEVRELSEEDQQYALKSLRDFVDLARKRSKRFG